MSEFEERMTPIEEIEAAIAALEAAIPAAELRPLGRLTVEAQISTLKEGLQGSEPVRALLMARDINETTHGAFWDDVAKDAEDPTFARALVSESEAIAHTDVVPLRTTSVNLRDLTDPAVTDPMKAEARADSLASLARTEKVRERNASAAPTIDAREFASFSPDTQKMMLDGGVVVVER